MQSTIEAWLLSKSWQYRSTTLQSRSHFETQVCMSNGQYELALFAHRYANFFGVYAYAPFTIAKAYHAELQEIIARANWGHEYARFELNPDSGQFRCASTAYLPDGTLSTAMIEHLSFFILEWLDSLVGTLADMRDDS